MTASFERGAYTELVTYFRNADALAELVTQSRSFMSNIAKAKTAKLSKMTTRFKSGLQADTPVAQFGP